MEAARIEALADEVTKLGMHALAFGRIQRTACEHPDGKLETDTDHTVALSWIAPALASLLYPQLDPCLVAAFASVHDAVEVFAGDTQTLRITPAERAAKAEREREAALQWQAEFAATLPWIAAMIGRYEACTEPEARFVKAVDKLCPAIVHAGCGARDIARFGITAGEIEANFAERRALMAAYAAEFPDILDLRDELSRRLVRLLRARDAHGIMVK